MKAALTTFGVHRNAASELMMEAVCLKAVAAQFGTPCYVYSKAMLERAYRTLNDVLTQAPIPGGHRICYAVKANSNLAVLSVFAKLGAGFDIVSGGELHRVLRAGGDAAKVVFSGVGKSEAEIVFALEAKIGCFNVESEPELERISALAAARGLLAPVSLRVNPDVDARTHPYISTGLRENKFGIASELAIKVYRRASQLPGIEIVGVDCHIGSQLTDAAPLVQAMGRIADLAEQLAGEGISLRHLCPGGGIGITYQHEQPFDVSAYVNALAAELDKRPHTRHLKLLLEPGRLLVGNAGLLLSQVEYVKRTPHRNFLILDAGMNDLMRPALYQAHHEIIPLSVKPGDAAAVQSDVVGPVCESADVFGVQRDIHAAPGDLVAILSAGAYGFVMASNYNSRPRPPEVLVDGAAMLLVRPRESIDDLLKGELPG